MSHLFQDIDGNVKARTSADKHPVKSSFLYDVLLDDITLAAGEERGVMVVVEGYVNVFVMALGEATYDVNSYPSPNASDLMPVETLATGIVANAGINKKVGQLAPTLYITMKNTSAASAKFSLWIYAI